MVTGDLRSNNASLPTTDLSIQKIPESSHWSNCNLQSASVHFLMHIDLCCPNAQNGSPERRRNPTFALNLHSRFETRLAGKSDLFRCRFHRDRFSFVVKRDLFIVQLPSTSQRLAIEHRFPAGPMERYSPFSSSVCSIPQHVVIPANSVASCNCACSSTSQGDDSLHL